MLAGIITIPKSLSPARIRENTDVNFDLPGDCMAKVHPVPTPPPAHTRSPLAIMPYVCASPPLLVSPCLAVEARRWIQGQLQLKQNCTNILPDTLAYPIVFICPTPSGF